MSEKNWLARVIEHEVDSHWDSASEWVSELRSKNPNADPDILVNDAIDSKARIAAFVGVGTGALQAVPAVGQALAIGSLLPEALYLAKVQIDIALVVALVYETKLTKDDVKGVIVTCLALALGADFVKHEINAAAVRLTRKGIERLIAKMGEKQLIKLLEKIGIQATKSGILKKVPLVGIPLNAGLNYSQIQGFGWTVKKFMSPTFVMCGACGHQTGKLNKFCPECGATLSAY